MAGKSQEDEEFQQILSEIGGKERIHLVSESWNPQDGNPPQLVEELVKDIFHSPFLEYRDDATDNFNHMASNISNGSVSAGDKSQENQTSFERTSTSNYVSRAKALHSSQGGELMQPQRPQGLEMNAKRDEEDTEKATAVKRGIFNKSCDPRGIHRAIDSPIIIFIFRQEFIICIENRICLKEILKDVKVRLKKTGVVPALLGLVYLRGQSRETCTSIAVLDQLMRSVFRSHSSETIWVGPFVPNTADGTHTIKKNVCRTLQSSLRRGNAVNRGSGLSEMLQCFPWSHRGVQRNAATSTSINGKQGGADCVEECVPLTKTSTANVQQAGCNMSG
ncbi:uncharacterized protein C2orf72 homolog isoform X1 [Brienomyrus brachyistius]|uniref:uncharacterized protein C2orf72 homolog isoform X1 n=1 Tax=Brienomyrus brachyistius TaxID=42636 RepID=UPI0020B39BAF|nr:uncharacterized protein C2orf72 homolog isoform X1 [Brienomyrus brachyistius]